MEFLITQVERVVIFIEDFVTRLATGHTRRTYLAFWIIVFLAAVIGGIVGFW